MVPTGLLYEDDAISMEFETQLIDFLDAPERIWNHTLVRRTQHYGYEYDYRSRNAAKPTTPIIGPLQTVKDRLATELNFNPTQCIVNEYLVNQGISPHIDASIFGPTIVSLSLLEPTLMVFTREKEKFELVLMPRSIVVLTDEARSQWKHQIPKQKQFPLPNGQIYQKSPRYRRISLIFRTLA